jgi:hypothetical protein
MIDQKDKAGATGVVNLVLKDEFGNVKEDISVPNLVVDTGLDFIADRMEGVGTNVMSHMEVGTGGTAAASGDTTLETAVGSSRTALTSTTVTNNTVEYVCTFAAGTGTGALVEAGIFNAGASGDMLCRTVFSVINKGANDSMTITWTITIS